MRKHGRGRRPLDVRSVAEAFSFPGSDPRRWVEYATVDKGEESVRFDPDFGYLVECTLQPSKVQVTARVSSQVAGNGEGEWNPFVSGDEVLVVIPGGNERAAPCIIGRLNNQIDKFPTGSVAGQDPTKNAFAFRRQRTPFVHEVAGPYLLRQATTGALLSFDAVGTLTIRNATSDAIQMSPDAFTFQSGDGESMLQLDSTNKRLTIKVGDAIITLSSSTAVPPVNAISTNGALQITTAAQPAAEHVISTESVAVILNELLNAIATAIPGPITGAALGGISAITFVAAALTQASQIGLNPLLAPVIQGLFAVAQQKPPAVPGFGQLAPGIGCPGTLVG